jgi:hypothetical protein
MRMIMVGTGLSLALAAGACRSSAFTAPSGSAIRLVASATTVALHGTVDLTAFVHEGALRAGAPGAMPEVAAGAGAAVHDGTEVFFTTSLGRIVPAETRTTGGRATARLVSDGRSGTAVVTAISGPASATVEIAVGAVVAARIAMTASPQTLASAGGTSTIAARVEQQAGNPVPGVLVSFSATRGTVQPAAATTNADGYAYTILHTAADAVVTATSGGSTAALAGTVIVTVKPPVTVHVSPPPGAMLGVPAAFTITPGPAALIRDVEIDFGDGDGQSLGAISSATNVSHLFRRTGELTVQVTATDGEGREATVSTRVAVAPLAASGTAMPSSTTLPRVGETITFQVAAAAGAVVERYRWDFGDCAIQTTASPQVAHAFRTAGSKTVSVRVFPLRSAEYTSVVIAVDVKP